MNVPLRLLLAAASLVASAPLAAAAPLPQQNRARATLHVRADGDDVKVAIPIRLDPGFHLYHGPTEADLGPEGVAGVPTTVEMLGEGFVWSAPRFPVPEIEDQGFGPTNVHYGTPVLYLRGRNSGGGDVATLQAKLFGQTCDPKGCVFYDETVENAGKGPDALFSKFPADLIAPAADAAAPASGIPGPLQIGGSSASRAHASLYVRASGEDVRAAIEIAIEPGFHLYHGPRQEDLGPPDTIGTPTTIEMQGDGFTWSEPRFPPPEVIDMGLGPTNVHEGTLVVYLLGRANPGADPATLQAKVAGQACDDKSCVDYRETVASAGAGPDAVFAQFPADLLVGATAAPRAGASAKPSVLDLGLWAFLGSAVAWGLFCLLMPCTYPMIPITISYFTKQALARKGNILPLSLCYGAGIVIVYVVIGLAFGRLIIPFATHWVTNLVIGAFFVLFALSLFGVILLQPPQFLMKAATSATKQGGYAGVFLMGTTLVVTSFTCTAPFVGSLLAAGASSGNLGRVALGMGVFGLTMAIPFVILSLVPGRVKQMPKAGGWSHTLKVTLGFVELAAALKFFSNVEIVWQWGLLSREVFLLLWAGIFALTSLYLFGVIRLHDDHEPVLLEPGVPVALHAGVSPKRFMAAIVFFLFGLYFLAGTLGSRLDWITETLAPPYSRPLVAPGGGGARSSDPGGGTTTAHAGEPWLIDDWDGALARAKSEKKLVAVNFTGFT